MEIKFNVKKKFVVNGKEYDSVEEMPADIRKIYEKAISGKAGIHHENVSSMSSGKIVFNGQEYENVESMPLDIRQMYEMIMKSVGQGNIDVTGRAGINMDGMSISFKKEGVLDPYSMSKPITPQSFFSPRLIILGAAIIIVLIALYFIFITGSR